MKEPLQILSSPFELSLFPGETVWFNVTVENLASVNYSAILGFSLNDTQYQAQFATFSNEEYNVVPGTQTLTAWLAVASEAPPGNFLITVNVTRQGEGVPPSQDSPLTLPKISLAPSLELLGNGARWAAGNGTSALVINWKDNYLAHNQTDGADWGPWPEEATMNNWSQSIQQALENTGFIVKSTGDLPENLSGYDLVVIHAYWAIEPRHNQLIRDYISNGGSVVILAGVPCYLNVYCKDLWPGNSMLPEWLGGGLYVNAGGNVTVTVNNPFGTEFSAGESILYANTSSCAAVSSPTNNGQIIARWSSDPVFAFTNEYEQGRVYYQATF